MRPSQLLTLSLASTATALESAANLVNIGMCRSPVHASTPLFRDVGACSQGQDGLVSQFDDEPSSLGWTHSSPCFRDTNGTSEYCAFSSATFAENRGITILTSSERARYFRQRLAFTKPEVIKGVNQDFVQDRTPVYKVVPIPGKDLGVVATKPLHRGDLIISNTASIMIDYGALEAVPPSDMLELQAAGLGHLPNEHLARILNLSTHGHIDDYLKRVEKLLATNAFDIEVGDDEEDSFYVVFPESQFVPCLSPDNLVLK